MAVTPRTKYSLRAPDDSELVKDGAKNLRDLCDDIATALDGVSNAKVSRGGDTMSGKLVTPALDVGVTSIDGAGTINSGRIHNVGDLTLHSSGGQIVIAGPAGTPASGTIALAPGVYGNQACTKGQLDAAITDIQGVIKFIHPGAVFSSRVLKKDIEPLPADDALDAFAKITPQSFTFKTADELTVDPAMLGNMAGTHHYGFIAEDVADAGVAVETVVAKSDESPEVLGLNPIDLIAVLWAKVQELEGRLAAVEGTH